VGRIMAIQGGVSGVDAAGRRNPSGDGGADAATSSGHHNTMHRAGPLSRRRNVERMRQT
jgi:hypothetical protein